MENDECKMKNWIGSEGVSLKGMKERG